MKTLLSLAFGLLLVLASARANNILDVSEQGTWTSACPALLCASQSDTWGYSFNISSNPSVFPGSTVGQYTLAAISNFEFYDNGTPVPALSNSQAGMYFYNINYGGGFGGGLSNFDGPLDMLAENTGQLYQGSELSPSFSPGTFAPGVVGLGVLNDGGGGTSPGPIVISAVPEPSSSALAICGCLGGLVFRLRSRRAAKTPTS